MVSAILNCLAKTVLENAFISETASLYPSRVKTDRVRAPARTLANLVDQLLGLAKRTVSSSCMEK